MVQRGAAFDSQRLSFARHDEQQADLSVPQDVAEAERQTIAKSLRNEEIAAVVDHDEPGWITFR